MQNSEAKFIVEELKSSMVITDPDDLETIKIIDTILASGVPLPDNEALFLINAYESIKR